MQDAGYRMQDARCRMQDVDPVCGFFEGRYLVPGPRCQVPDTGHLEPDTRYPMRSDAEGRVPSTEDRARPRLGPGDSAMEG